MKTSEIIKQLQNMVYKYGDLEFATCCNELGLLTNFIENIEKDVIDVHYYDKKGNYKIKEVDVIAVNPYGECDVPEELRQKFAKSYRRINQ